MYYFKKKEPEKRLLILLRELKRRFLNQTLYFIVLTFVMAEGFLAAALAALSAAGEIRGITIADNSSNDLYIYIIFYVVVYDISQRGG